MTFKEDGRKGEPQLPPEVTAVPKEAIRNFPHTKRVGSYLLGRTLGEGSFAKVKEALHTPTGVKVAIKVIDKKKARKDNYVRRNMRRETKILQQVRHPNVVSLYETMETENSYYIVTELCRGGDVMDLMCRKKRLDERETRRYMRQIISAVHHLHRAGIIHRDLKIENLLLDEHNNIKLIDFGLSNNVRVSGGGDGGGAITAEDLCATQCGSPAYAAPELLGAQKYGLQADVWSIGVNMFAMLTGNLPFTVEPFSIRKLYNKMTSGDMNALPQHLSADCVDLLKRLLTPDPDTRITLEEAMGHPWITHGSTELRSAPFPNRLRPEEVRQEVVRHMSEVMGHKVGETIRFVVSNVPHASTATYHLLCRRILEHSTTSTKSTRKLLLNNKETSGATKAVGVERRDVANPAAQEISESPATERDTRQTAVEIPQEKKPDTEKKIAPLVIPDSTKRLSTPLRVTLAPVRRKLEHRTPAPENDVVMRSPADGAETSPVVARKRYKTSVPSTTTGEVTTSQQQRQTQERMDASSRGTPSVTSSPRRRGSTRGHPRSYDATATLPDALERYALHPTRQKPRGVPIEVHTSQAPRLSRPRAADTRTHGGRRFRPAAEVNVQYGTQTATLRNPNKVEDLYRVPRPPPPRATSGNSTVVSPPCNNRSPVMLRRRRDVTNYSRTGRAPEVEHVLVEVTEVSLRSDGRSSRSTDNSTASSQAKHTEVAIQLPAINGMPSSPPVPVLGRVE